MTKDDGGPAFPLYLGDNELSNYGMRLRDYFASHEKEHPSVEWLRAQPDYDSTSQLGFGAELIARWRYRMADAMLKERSK